MSAAVPSLESDALAWIFGIPDSSEFLERYLGQAWYHAENSNRERFADLLSLAQLDEILGNYGISHPTVRLVRADQDVPPSEYLWRDRLIDPVQAGRLFSEGSTVIFGALHERHEGMRRLAAGLARQATGRAQTNIYLTPPDSQGFKVHWDTHDVFVLQVEGSKRWRIYEGGPEAPLRNHKFDPERDEHGEVEAEFTLHAGEVLYIPRGIMHAAATTDEISLHITLGLIAYSWADLLADCLAEVTDREPGWRANVPFGLAQRDPQGHATLEQLRELLRDLGDQVDLPKVIAERQRVFDGVFRPRSGDLLRQAVGSPSIDESDWVTWRPGMPETPQDRDGRLVLSIGGREVDFPAAAARTIEALSSGEAARAGGLDDGLDWESRRVVLSALAREGYVQVHSREPAG